MKIGVLRLDHRQHRDHRMTTHVALSSRALGAQEFNYTGDKDLNLETTILDVVKRWGGKFTINHSYSAIKFVKQWNGIRVHLTMYGESHLDTIKTLKQYSEEDILIIVGGSKVPRYVYANADFNTSIGWQPHSEVAALSIFLHSLLGNQHLYLEYDDSEMSIMPDNKKSMRSQRFQK